MSFKKILVHKDQSKITGELNQLKSHIEYFQGYTNKLLTLGIKINNNELNSLFDNPKAFITDKLTSGENVKVGGLSLDKDKLFELLNKPKGTIEIIESILTDIADRSKREYHIWKVKYFSVQNDLVIVNPEYLEEITQRHSLFIESENQNKAFEKLQKIAALLNDLNKLECIKYVNSNSELTDLMNYDTSGFAVNPTTLKRFK